MKICCLAVLFLTGGSLLSAAESLWIEAEHFDGIKNYCWPMGRPNMKQTAGHWGLSGPGWAAEWNQGGESGFLSIATGPDDDKAVAAKTVEIPSAGQYFLWIRYGDWREKTERFQVQLEQAGQSAWTGRFGETPRVDEDNEAKLYWGWAFVWDRRPVTLQKGPATIKLLSTSKDPEARQIDVLVLSSDASYLPRIKDRPANPSWKILESYRQGIPADLTPLARAPRDFSLPAAWKLRTFQDRGFLYLWNMSAEPPFNWFTDDPQRVLFPYMLRDEDARKEFEQIYAGRSDVPIFSDPRIVPTFHGAGPRIFAADAKTGALKEPGQRLAKWLDANPRRRWATLMNYAPDLPLGEQGVQAFQKYRDRYIGAVSGENLGYFQVDPQRLQEAAATAQTRRQLAEAITRLSLEANAAKYRKIYGKDLDANAYQDVIACLSVGNMAFGPLCYDWGARTLGYESAAVTSTVLPLRWAFLRGLARQWGGATATYRSCNFGDSATMFSVAQSYTSPKNILDNYYSVYSGAGMTWYKMDLWYQYMAGSSMFYHEQGFDEFWKPGGTTAAGLRPVQLSPKGLLVDRFLRVTAQQPDRGHPYTPIAFLVDYAHGWEPSPYWPNSFKNYHQQPERFRFGPHEKMLEEYFWTAFYPIGPESQRPITGTNEVFVPGVFGDVFDVILAYPDVASWRTIDTYPVVIVAGDIELTAPEGKRLADYVQRGGTLLVADEHLTGPGAKLLELPATGQTAEADSYRWLADETIHASPRFRFRAIEGGRPLAATSDGRVFCAAVERGQGRLLYLSVPRGLSISRQALPVLPRLFAHLSRGLMPIEVAGPVQWLVNRAEHSWLVTLLNPAGQLKPQQGITPADYRQNKTITIRSHVPIRSAQDRLLPTDSFTVRDNSVTLEVPAGAVRIIELQ